MVRKAPQGAQRISTPPDPAAQGLSGLQRQGYLGGPALRGDLVRRALQGYFNSNQYLLSLLHMPVTVLVFEEQLNAHRKH